MNNPSSPVVEAKPPTNVSFKPFLPPPNLTRWQRFCSFMKTPESGLVPMGILVVAGHAFAFHYLFLSDDFLDDFEDDPEANALVKKIVDINKSMRYNFDRIRETFSGFKG